MIILATISINAVLGENGIIKKAEKTRELQSHASVGEAIRLAYIDYEFEQTTGITASLNETKLASVETGIKVATANNETFLEYLIHKGYTDENGVVKVENLLGKSTGIGEGTGNSDVYKLEETEEGKYELNYYNKEEEQLNLGEVGAVKEAEVDPNKIIDILYVQDENEIYVLTQAGEVKCLTGENAKPSNVTSWKKDNEVTISQSGVKKEAGEMYFIDNAGKLYMWGYLAEELTGKEELVCVNDIEGSSLNGKSVTKFDGYNFAIDSEGKVHAWGNNYYGQLGNGTTEKITVPTCISDIPNSELNGKEIVNIQEDRCTYAIDSEGKVYAWGNNYYGQLGNGTTEDSNVPICTSDIPNSELNGKEIVDIQSSNDSTLAVDSEGKVYAWGKNNYGQLGNGNEEDVTMPVCISDIPNSALKGKEVVVVKEWSTTYAIDSEGKVYAWGDNNYGQLGNGTTEKITVPTCISDIPNSELNGKEIVNIQEDRCTYAVDSEGKVYAWGKNNYGQLGNGTTEDSNVPVCISDIPNSELNGKEIVDIQEYNYSSRAYAIDSEGKVYAWGLNSSGELGNGSEENATMPICINDIENSGLSNKKIKEVGFNYEITIYLTEDGELYYSAFKDSSPQ